METVGTNAGGSQQNTSALAGQPNVTTTPLGQKSPHVKRAKWHLGIRSQSRPGSHFNLIGSVNERGFLSDRIFKISEFLSNLLIT